MVYKALMTERTAVSSVNVETLARKHAEDARAEADKLRDDAQTEAKMIIENAYLILSNAKRQAQKLIDDANAEAARIKKHSLKLLCEAEADLAGISLNA